MIDKTLAQILLALHATGHLQGDTPNDHDWKVLVSDDNPRFFHGVTWFKTHPERRSSPTKVQPLIESLLKEGGAVQITRAKGVKETSPSYRSHYVRPNFDCVSGHAQIQATQAWIEKIKHIQDT